MVDLPRSGLEWMVDAQGCEARRLQDPKLLQSLFDEIVRDIGLHPLGKARWHRFPITSGQTGFWILTESHLACHTFPEHKSICLNLFCCRPRQEWPWRLRLREVLGAESVRVRKYERNYGLESIKERAC